MVMEASILVQKAALKGSGCAIHIGELQFLGLMGYVAEGNGWVICGILLQVFG